MSVIIPSGGAYGLYASTNLSNPQSFTKLLWAQFAGTPTGTTKLQASYDATSVYWASLGGGYTSGDLAVITKPQSGVWTNFSSQPNWTNWNCYALTGTTAAAGSLIGYWQDNAGDGFLSASATGQNFTNSQDQIGHAGTQNQAITVAFYMEWNTVLTPAQIATQFSSPTPIVALGNLSRYLAMSSVASAGTDTSGNGYNMGVSGTLTLGASSPSFPASANLSSSSGGIASASAQLVPSLLSFARGLANFGPFGIFETAARGVASGSGLLIGLASVTLTSPPAPGIGTVYDPYLWTTPFPQPGDVIYYDPTYITIDPGGGIYSTSNNCSALIQFYRANVGWTEAILVITPYDVSYAQAQASLIATLSGAAQALLATSTAVASLTPTLLTNIPAAAAPAVIASLLSTLSSGAGMVAQGAALASSVAALSSGVALATAAQGLASAADLLSTGIAASAQVLSKAGSQTALSAQGHFASVARAQASATPALSLAANFIQSARALAAVRAALSTIITVAGSGSAHASISASLLVPRSLNNQAQGRASAQASLSIGSGFKAQSYATAAASGSLFYGINLATLISAEATFDPPLLVTLQLLTQPVLLANQIPGIYQPTPEPWGQFNISAGQKSFYGIDWTYWICYRWQPGYSAAQGYVVRPFPWTGFEYICTQAGQTANYPPVWPEEIGQYVVDGSVIWQAQALGADSLQTTVVSALYNVPAGITAIPYLPQGNLTPVLIDATLASPGTSYAVACVTQMASGDFLVGQMIFDVSDIA